MSDIRTPIFIKHCYSFIVMMIFCKLPTPTVSSPSSSTFKLPTSSPIVTLPIEGSTCFDTCGSERELVNNDNVKGQLLKYNEEGKKKKIHCLDTSNITNMKYLLSGDENNGDAIFQSFNMDLNCWDVSSVTSMHVST